jgi:hypothetical protein
MARSDENKLKRERKFMDEKRFYFGEDVPQPAGANPFAW